MGFGSNGKKTLYQLTGLTHIDVTTITRERAKEKCQDQRAVVDFDCNNIIYFVRIRAMGVVEETAKFLMQWAAYGIITMPVCDGDTQPITKIASHKNQAKRERSHISAIVNQQKLNEVTSWLNSDGLTAEEQESAISEQKSLETKIKQAETNPVPLQFLALLEAKLEHVNAHNPIG